MYFKIILTTLPLITLIILYIVESSINYKAKKIRDQAISYTAPITILIMSAPTFELWLTGSYISIINFLVVIGLLLIILGFALRIAVHLFWLKIIKLHNVRNEKLELITDGLYKSIRNPMWSSTLLLLLGFTFFSHSISSFLILIFFWLPLNAKQLKLEEEYLFKIYGDKFKKYLQKSWRLIPFLY